MTAALEYFVPGRPRPKGSWKPVPIKGRTVLVPDNKRSAPWARVVAAYTRIKMSGPPWEPDVPVGIRIRFFFRRPDSHYRTRNKRPDRSPEGLKDRSMPFPMGRRNYPDTDKLERNVWDAITKIVYEDDIQIVKCGATKEWGEEEGALITVWKIKV